MKKHITDLKNDLRSRYRKVRRDLSPEAKAQMDEEICRHIINTVSFRYAEYILMYAPMADEVNVLPVAEEALRRGKKILFPRCNTELHTMTYHFVTQLSQLSNDAYGIPAPPEDASSYHTSDKTAAMCLVPGLIYDKYGYRVGYGKGYYDRFLSKFCGCKAGIVYSDFILPTVPKGYYDLKVDIMITERNVKVPLEG